MTTDHKNKPIDTSDTADAARFRWLLHGNGYFMEESMLCGHGPCSEQEMNEARAIIDEAMEAELQAEHQSTSQEH